jgi:hypothetical protein
VKDLASWTLGLAFWLLLVLSGALGIHHFKKGIRALRSGVVVGLVLGQFGKKFTREADTPAFWLNVCTGFFVAALGLIAILWAILLVVMLIAAYRGYPTL